MEIKAKLTKPCSDEQRMNFIAENNHQKGYKIEETEEAIEALGYTKEEKRAIREAEFNKQFFNTSLGYIRRSVTMQDGSKKDFLADLLLPIKAGLENGQNVNIIAYNKPSFDYDVTDWIVYQHIEAATQKFIAECLQQVVIDFGGIN